MNITHSFLSLVAAVFVGCIAPALQAAEIKEHVHEKKGDWTVSYFTSDGKFLYVQMTKTFDRKETRLRLKLSDVETTVEAAADFNGIDSKAEFVQASIWTDDVEPNKVRAFYFEEKDGEQLMRIGMPNDDPGFLDGFSNGKKLFIQFGKVKWQFDLKGTNPAFKSAIALLDSKRKK